VCVRACVRACLECAPAPYCSTKRRAVRVPDGIKTGITTVCVCVCVCVCLNGLQAIVLCSYLNAIQTRVLSVSLVHRP
jgi:hypothetical protein